uniref:Methyltransferase like 6 n=1 Tax=Sinocyclocheilus rhinocerous TaxID=307959 RepID=A0A673J9F0_9TELE
MSVTGELDSLESSPAFPHQSTCLSERTLNPEELEKLRTDRVSDFKQQKLEMDSPGQKLVLLEAGCGVGNCIFPLLEEGLNIFIYACDFSPQAVEFVKVKIFNLKPFLIILHIHTLFCMHSALIYDYLLLLQQNALYCTERCLAFQCWYPSLLLIEYLAGLFQQAGFETLVNEYVLRETVNKKEGLCVPRVFLQSKFRKPVPSLSPA